uniref:C-type lectin domain-containing protein n=1 Tax=Plectus sambesii TaxID=2011161 RepID=A0A914WQJ5_9BILA
MSQSDRKAILKTIEEKPIDPQNVLYLSDDKSSDKVAICVEDFVTIANGCQTNTNSASYKSRNAYSSTEGDTTVPQGLRDAFYRNFGLSLGSMSEYWYIGSESGYSSASDQARSRGESTGSEGSTSSSAPLLPESRPPPLPSSPAFGSSINQQHFVSHDAGMVENVILLAERSKSTTDENTEANTEENWEEMHPVRKHRFLLPFIIAVVAIIAAALALGIHSLTTRTAPLFSRRNATYDCVGGSTLEILLDSAEHPLVKLNIPEKYPTITVENLEYLLVPSVTKWWDAQKYCTAWCGYLVSIKTKDENDKILKMVRQHLPQFSHYWIGVKNWNKKWYLDNEYNLSYSNFAPHEQDLVNNDDKRWGCVKVDDSGLWSWSMKNCDAMLPFVCERNTADPKIQRTPFAPHQETRCQDAGGMCKMDNDCADGNRIRHLCPDQPIDIICCIPKEPKPTPSFNSSLTTCIDAGGICNHVIYDECRDGLVVYNLSQSCPDSPRQYDCCVKN